MSRLTVPISSGEAMPSLPRGFMIGLIAFALFVAACNRKVTQKQPMAEAQPDQTAKVPPQPATPPIPAQAGLERQATAQRAVEPPTCPPGLRLRYDTSEGIGFFQCVVPNPVVIAGLPTLGCVEWAGTRWKPNDFVSCEDPKARALSMNLTPNQELEIMEKNGVHGAVRQERFEQLTKIVDPAMPWQPERGQTLEDWEDRREIEEAIRGIRPGQSQREVKLLLLSRGFPPWTCQGTWGDGDWEVRCYTSKPWVAWMQNEQPQHMLIGFDFSVYKRVVYTDPDTQVSYPVNRKTDELLRILVPCPSDYWRQEGVCNDIPWH
jgi:hypothetical protein